MSMAMIATVLGPLLVEDLGPASDPAVLFWPSLFTDHGMWHGQVPALREAGWRTLAVDPPGHGRSLGPGRRFTMDECAEAAIQVLDAATACAPVVIIGTSWGGFVAPRIALRAADRIRGMVLFNTSAQRPLPGQWAKAQLLTSMMGFGALDGIVDGIVESSLLAPETRRREPRIGADLLSRLRTWDRRRTVITACSVLIDRTGFLDELTRVAAPVLVVSGGEDHVLPPILGRRMAKRLPKGRHVEVPGAAHLVPLEARGSANALILGFLADLEG